MKLGILLCALAIGLAVTAPIETGVERAEALPSVTVPSVPPLPSVTVTVASLPPVTVPSLPPVPALPPLPQPPPLPLPLPPAPTPTLAPSLPPVPDPPVVPAAPGVSSPQGPARSESSSASSAPTSSSAAESKGPAQSTAGSSAGADGAPAHHAAGRSRHRTSAPKHRRVRAQRRLRELVTRSEGCLGQLGEAERQVLTLRAGAGPGAALSRAQTARRLGLSGARVARIERRGLRRLVRVRHASACTRPGAVASVSPSSVLAAALLDPRGGTGGASRDRGAVKGVSAHGGGDRNDSSVPLPPTPPSGVLIALAFGAGILALIFLVRRELPRR